MIKKTGEVLKVLLILVDRANYGRLRPVMRELLRDPGVSLTIICSGSTLLEKYGKVSETIKADGFTVDEEVLMEVDGNCPQSMALSVGMGVIQFAGLFARRKSDVTLLIGDRYEALAAAIASVYSNIPVAHIQGGEVSGSIDESARHAITKLAHLHFPSTERAKKIICAMGEDPRYVHNVGCPSGDEILRSDNKLCSRDIEGLGVGADIDLGNPFLLVCYHPVTTNFGSERENCTSLLKALEEIGLPTIWIWPNIDAGSDAISKTIRIYREKHQPKWLKLIKHIETPIYQALMKNCKCAIGNSSSFVRDSSFMGTPVVLVGNRQNSRECAENVVKSSHSVSELVESIQRQIQHGIYPRSNLYGTGNASSNIVRLLKAFEPYVQKTFFLN